MGGGILHSGRNSLSQREPCVCWNARRDTAIFRELRGSKESSSYLHHTLSPSTSAFCWMDLARGESLDNVASSNRVKQKTEYMFDRKHALIFTTVCFANIFDFVMTTESDPS